MMSSVVWTTLLVGAIVTSEYSSSSSNNSIGVSAFGGLQGLAPPRMRPLARTTTSTTTTTTLTALPSSLQPLQEATSSLLLSHNNYNNNNLFATAANNPFQSLVLSYQTALAQHALPTQIVTGIVLAVVGDAIAQKWQASPSTTNKDKDSYNIKRALSFCAFDAAYRSVQHYVYPPMIALCQGNLFGPLLLPHNPLLAAALEQSLASQLIIIPLLYYPCFFVLTGAVQGLTWRETWDRARTTFVPLMARNLLFWVPIQFGVFLWIPDQATQIPILIACGLVWTIILSAVAGAATPKMTMSSSPQDTGAFAVVASEQSDERSDNGGRISADQTNGGDAPEDGVAA